jgi:hypothetical protein
MHTNKWSVCGVIASVGRVAWTVPYPNGPANRYITRHRREPKCAARVHAT